MQSLRLFVSVLLFAGTTGLIGCRDGSQSPEASQPPITLPGATGEPAGGPDGEITALALSDAAAAGSSSNRFVVPGQFSIAEPIGYAWKHETPLRAADETGELYTCRWQATPEGNAAVSLTIEDRSLTTDAARYDHLANQYNALLASFQGHNFTDMSAAEPDLSQPIADRVSYALRGKDPSGQTMYVRGIVVFGRRTYTFQIGGIVLAEVDKLARTVDTFREE